MPCTALRHVRHDLVSLRGALDVRVASKFGLALMPAVLTVLGAFAGVRVQREMTLFREDAQRDQRIVATTLARAVEAVWTRQGPEAALAMLRDADAARSGVSVRWVSLEATPRPEVRPLLPRAELGRLESQVPLQKLWEKAPSRSWEEPEESLTTYAPVTRGGHSLGAVEVSESLASASGYLAETLRNTFLLTASLALVCVLVMWAVGARLISGPVRLLLRRAHEIGSGKEGTPLALTQRDELGDLARALDEAARLLSEANQRVGMEEAARLSAQEQLRHAERLATAGRLASALAHEIGTPLNVASGHAQLIALRRLDADQAVESAKTIRGQCDRIAKLVRQLLDFAKRRAPKLEQANLADVARVTVDLLGHLAKRRQVSLVFEAHDDGSALADTFQTQQALTNVVMNAIQASPAGGEVRVTLNKCTQSHPEQQGAGPAEYIVISVRDSGPGVLGTQAERLFEPFFTTKASGEGTGLGLSITRDILREHGGWIRLRPDLGPGVTTFELGWPASSALPSASPLPLELSPARGRGNSAALSGIRSATGYASR